MPLRAAALSIIFLAIASPAFAVGPSLMAKSDRSLWPEKLDSKQSYDRASRAEILVFSTALTQVSNLDETALKEELHINSVNKASISKVRDYLTNILIDNFKIASKSCAGSDMFCYNVNSANDLYATATQFSESIPDNYRSWLENSKNFHHIYAIELIRLAALFPKISSEIDTFNRNERNGFEMPDSHFQLSFDDGPTTKNGNSDILIKILSKHNLHALFFLLGDRLQERLNVQDKTSLQQLYDGQCVALHGWHHVSHQKAENWQNSILETQHLVKDTFPSLYSPYFRPPYAQRPSDSESFFKNNSLNVSLWNIDTQDWSNKVSGQDAANRALTLMLVWRRGMFLFHDIHAKAQIALPWLLEETKNTGIVWDDCHNY